MATAVLPGALLANLRFQVKLSPLVRVGIEGSLASSKRVLSEYLEHSLDGVVVVHADDLWSTEMDRAVALEQLGAELLEPLAAGRAGHVRLSSLRDGVRRTVEPLGVVVVEGTGLLSPRRLTYFDVTVLVPEAVARGSDRPNDAPVGVRYVLQVGAPFK